MSEKNQSSYAEILLGAVERLLDVTTPKGLAHWLESELRPIFPFGAYTVALGRTLPDINLSPICSSGRFPESLLRSFRVLSDGTAVPLLQQWLNQQKPIVIELDQDYPGMPPLWLNVLRQSNFRSAAVHAAFDIRGRRLIYVCLLDLGIKNPEAARRILNILMPHLCAAVGQIYRSMRRVQKTPHTALSLREREILKWIREGKTNREIADTLGLSFKTVKNHVENILSKLGVTNRAEAVAKALSQDFLESHLDLPTQGIQLAQSN